MCFVLHLDMLYLKSKTISNYIQLLSVHKNLKLQESSMRLKIRSSWLSYILVSIDVTSLNFLFTRSFFIELGIFPKLDIFPKYSRLESTSLLENVFMHFDFVRQGITCALPSHLCMESYLEEYAFTMQ